MESNRHSSKKTKRLLSIRWQLVVAVNSVCAILVVSFLVYDYRRELVHRMEDKRVALREEAFALHAAIRGLEPQGKEALQSYVDSVCAGMQERQSPGHHIAVRIGDDILQAHAHHRASDEMFQAMEAASATSNHHGEFQGQNLIVGTVGEKSLQVFVSEYFNAAQQGIVQDALRRLAGLTVLALVAAAVVNALLVGLVIKPLQRLMIAVDKIGSGDFGQKVDGFRSSEFSKLSTAFNRMSDSLADARQRRRNQLAKAREIQEHLLPRGVEIPGTAISVLYEPAEEVAGDYYDIMPLSDKSWLICIADVTGHGIPAAMSAALLKAFLRDATEKMIDLIKILERVNQRFTESTISECFATMLLVRINPHTQTFQYLNAGHESGLFQSGNGEICELRSSGLLVGIDPEAEWVVNELPTKPGDRIILHTDGVTETFNHDRQCFGMERFTGSFAACENHCAQKVVDHIKHDLDNFQKDVPAHDDVTLICIEFL